MTLYDEIGGEATIAAIVAGYWHRVSDDELLSGWFGKVDPDALQGHLRAYLAVAFGGPEAYGGRSMRHAHSGLRITDEAFGALMQRMNEALAASGSSPETIQRADRRLRSLQAVIVEPDAK